MVSVSSSTSVQLSTASYPKIKVVSFHAYFGKREACILTVFMRVTHTGSERPNYKCWHPRGPRLVPRTHTRLTHSASSPQRNKGDFMSLFKSLGFGYILPHPYMDLLRTDLFSITKTLGPDLALGMLRAAFSCGNWGQDD